MGLLCGERGWEGSGERVSSPEVWHLERRGRVGVFWKRGWQACLWIPGERRGKQSNEDFCFSRRVDGSVIYEVGKTEGETDLAGKKSSALSWRCWLESTTRCWSGDGRRAVGQVI